MSKNFLPPIKIIDDIGLKVMPLDEAQEALKQHSKLIDTLTMAENSELTGLDLSYHTFGKLVNHSLPLTEDIVHVEIDYIRDFLFNKNWEHLKYLDFSYQNLSETETNKIMLSIINVKGQITLDKEKSEKKMLYAINLSGNEVASETLNWFSTAIPDPKKLQDDLPGMLHLQCLNLTDCGIDPADEYVLYLQDMGVNVIIEDGESASAAAAGGDSSYLYNDMP